MRLKHIGYGIFVSTAATIGTVLWYDRPDHMIKLEDRLELRMGYAERCLATQISHAGDPYISTVTAYEPGTVGVETVTFSYPDPLDPTNQLVGIRTNTFFIPDPADPTNQIERPYSIIAPHVVTGLAWYPPSSCIVIPPGSAGTVVSYDYSNRFYIGAWSNAIVSGFVGSQYLGRNGTYSNNTSINSYTRGFLFKKVGGGFFDYFTYDGHATIFSGTSGQELTRAMLPWFNDLPAVGTSTTQYPVVTMTNRFDYVDHPLFTVEPFSGWPTLSIMDSWAVEMGIIDKGLFGEFITTPANSTSVVTRFQIYNSLLWGDRYIKATNELITPIYLAPSNFNIEAFGSPTNLALDVPGLMTNIGGVSSNLFGFSPLWLFPDIRVYRSGFWVNYARLGFQPSRALFEMRYNAVQALKTTLSWSTVWRRAETTNFYIWQGTGSNWAEAVAGAGLVASYGLDGFSPMCMTMGRRDSASAYTFRAARRSAFLAASCINTNTQSALAFYAQGGTYYEFPIPWSWSILTTNLQANTFFNYGEAGTVSNYCRIDNALTMATRSNAVSTVALGGNSPLTEICDEPIAIGASTAKGYYIEDGEIMIDWAFRHCVNSL
jgi:hypothetical protein